MGDVCVVSMAACLVWEIDYPICSASPLPIHPTEAFSVAIQQTENSENILYTSSDIEQPS